MTRSLRIAPALAAFVVAAAGCTPPRAPASAPAPAAPDERTALRALVDSLVGAPEWRNAHWGVLIVDPARGDTLYSRNAGKLFMPASNMKLVTGAVALAQLGPDFRFRTTVVAAGRVRDGVLEGDLVVHGRGDPSLSDAMRGDAMTPLREMADSLRARGITRIAGRIVAGDDVFPDSPVGYGWSWDAFDAPYSAGVDELFFNEGFARVAVRAQGTGRRAIVTTAPDSTWPPVRNEVSVAEQPAGGAALPSPRFARDSATGGWVVRGTLAPGDSAVEELAFPDQRTAYLAALTRALAERGVTVARGTVSGGRADTLFTYLSPPLREIMPHFEKPSQNQIGEILFKTLGLERTGIGTADSGRAVVERQLQAWGAEPDGYVVRDGSGLARYNYVTPETIVRVLAAARRDTAFAVFHDALPIAGVDGTIRNRMKGTPAQGNAHAKTGFVAQARSLSGYVSTADGVPLLFSLLCNNWTTPTRSVERVQDAIVARLAGMRLTGAAP